MITLHHFVDSRPAAGRSSRFTDVFNPATGECTARLPLADAKEVAGAVAVVLRALPLWAGTPAMARAQVLFRFKSLIDRVSSRWPDWADAGVRFAMPTLG